MESILEFLKNNQGHPVHKEDIFKAYGASTAKDQQVIMIELNRLIKQGAIYPFQNGFYLTAHGEKLIINPAAEFSYSGAANLRKPLAYHKRDTAIITNADVWKEWANYFIKHFNMFSKNHPELAELFQALNVKAIEDLALFHDTTEFMKDVQAIFHNFDFNNSNLRYGPSEPHYSVPVDLSSIEYAIAESLNRLLKYSPRHKHYLPYTEKYKKVYDFINNYLDTEWEPSALMRDIFLKTGSFMSKSLYQAKLVAFFTSLSPVKDNNLIKIALDQLGNKISEKVKTVSTKIFIEGEDPNIAGERLYRLIQQDEESLDVLSTFCETVGGSRLGLDTLSKSLSDRDFLNFVFDRLELPPCSISNSNFTGASFRGVKFEGTSIQDCDFTDADFTSAQLISVSNFSKNILQGADFKNANTGAAIEVENNIGTPLNLMTLKVTKEEMKASGFGGKESFDHVGVPAVPKGLPYYKLDATGETWVRYIYASQKTPFPKELFDLFALEHGSSRVPGNYVLGWVGGKWDASRKILYVTELQSDLLQRTFELSNKWLDEAERGEHGFTADSAKVRSLRALSPYKSKLENYYDGWQYVFMNQAVREAKVRGAEYIYVPTASFYKKTVSNAPAQYYDKIASSYTAVPSTDHKWWKIPVNNINKFATLNKLSLDPHYWEKYVEVYIKEFIKTMKETEPGVGNDLELARDAFNYMLDHIPEDIKHDSDFPDIVLNLREALIREGIGDIFSEEISIRPHDINQTINKPDDKGGDQLVDREGNPIDEPYLEEDISSYESPQEEEPVESVNDLLDQLSQAKREGNQAKVEEIKSKLDKLIGYASLRSLSWQLKESAYKDLRFNYNPDRGQQLDTWEPAKGDSSALNPLDMQMSWNTDMFEPDTEHTDKENHSLDWQDRSNNNLWV